ncbi:hypothetical protein Nepgr_022730 [Nepenthes gracilis]|uniref:RING-type domain-containing protein n=1 Tax=Nepenthes gracilis TaxID=150966 RepID=A0AAD3T0U7_NEPGR|nr:hypothetical protein Nepgr_022730 [Nepenthes gracilis]
MLSEPQGRLILYNGGFFYCHGLREFDCPFTCNCSVSMGQQQSKDQVLYDQAIAGNVEAVKALCREGARLEWIDKEGKTPLIVACMDSGLYNMAKTLIELGANVNAYRPGRHAGTPLHHASKRGVDQTVRLLLSHGANAFLRNDDGQRPLDVARTKGHTNVVRTIEGHICCFSGYVREVFGPGFLEALVPQLLSRKIWAVVMPCSPQNPKFELLIYLKPQDAQPRTTIALWMCKIEEPKFHQSDPSLIIFDQTTKTRFKFASAIEGDKRQFLQLYNACKGTSQVTLLDNAGSSDLSAGTTAAACESAPETRPPSLPSSNQPIPPADATNGQVNTADKVSCHESGSSNGPPPSLVSSSGWTYEPAREGYNGWGGLTDPVPTPTQPQCFETSEVTTPINLVPSAPPIPVDDAPIRYPMIDLSPVELSAPAIDDPVLTPEEVKEKPEPTCVICWEAPVEGACIPCGHMAGCLPCLKEIKAKKGVCPVCRANIDQVIRLYAV